MERDAEHAEDNRNWRDFEEMESASTTTESEFDPAAVKLEGEKVPEDLRGKSVAEVAEELKRARAALKISEDARLALRQSSEAVETSRRPVAPQPVAAAQPVEEEELTDEKFEEMYNTNPARAMRVLAEQNQRRFERKVMGELRGSVSTLASGTAGSVEQMMRQRYAEEFAILGPEIEAVKAQVPVDQLTNPANWEQLIFYVRGQHVDKYLTAKQQRDHSRSIEEARSEQREGTPPNFSRGSNGGAEGRERGEASLPRGRSRELDATQKEIARTLGVSEADYKKWDF